MPAAPGAKLLLKLSPKLPPVLAGTFLSTSAMVGRPLRWMSSRVITSTGATPSVSVRLMFDPVTWTRSRRSGVVCANDGAAAANSPVPSAPSIATCSALN